MKFTVNISIINVLILFGLITKTICFNNVNINTAKLIFFPGPTNDVSQTYSLTNAVNVLQHSKFNLNRSTVIYAHGYQENLSRESIQTVVAAYLYRNDTNFILFDWSVIANEFYLKILLQYLLPLSERLANVLIELFENNLNIDNVHLIGHSFGAQILGVTGRSIQKQTNGRLKIKRITGLDPAGPGFFIIVIPINNILLDANDAEFVDIIHTDAGLYGAPIPTGSVDFWPNQGHRFQTGCPKGIFESFSDNDLCSHWKSWMYWAESVANKYPVKFLACQIKNFNVDCSHAIPMGIDCPKNSSGNYYLKTNAKQPYARGLH